MPITATTSTQTFLFADIVAFTAITEEEGDLRATELAVTLALVTQEVASELGADLVKTIGDAVMVRCDDARTALELALRLRRELARIPGFPGIHAGLHTGSAIHAAGDWYGHTVNVAARVCGAAGPGEVFCTRATLDAAGELTGIRVTPCGARAFKNAAAHVGVFRLDRVLTPMGPRLQATVQGAEFAHA